MACNIPAAQTSTFQMPSQTGYQDYRCHPSSVGLNTFQLYFTVYCTLPIDVLMQCGDIESNPGPALLSESQLKDLLAGRLNDKPDVLLNQHVQQLQQLKRETSSTWSQVHEWLAQLMEVVEKPSNAPLTAQWTKLSKVRQNMVRDSHRDKSLLENWNNEQSNLPTHKKPTGPRASTSDTTSKFVFDQLKLENESLKEEVATLTCRPSPQKGKQEVKDLNKLVDKRDTQLEKAKMGKRLLEGEFKELNYKCQRLEHDLELEQSRAEDLEQKIKEQKEHILELQEANAKLRKELEVSKSKHK